MTTAELLRPEDVVALWLDGGDGSPAGPVFTGGKHVEADITMTDPGQSGRCGTACTGSSRWECC